MRTVICLLALSLLLAGCGSPEPDPSAIQTAIAETQEAQAFEAAIHTAIAETQEAQVSTSPQPTVESPQDTPVAQATPTIRVGQPEATPLPPSLEPTPAAESQEVQVQSIAPSLVLASSVSSFAIAGGRIFIDPGDNSIGAFDIRAGESLWAASAGGKVLGADPDLVYAGPAPLRVDALDARTGEFRWRFLSQEPAPPLTANGKFVLLAGESTWYVLDKSNGTVVSTSRADRVREPSGLGSNSIVTGSKYGRLSDDGHLEWLRSDVDRSLFCDGIFVYTGTDPSGGLEAIDENTGSPLWKADTPSLFAAMTWYRSVFLSAPYFFPSGWGGGDFLPTWNSDLVVCGTENVYVYTDERETLAALSKATGELRWRGLALTENSWVGEADGMVIYSRDSYGWTQAYGATDHTMIWENPHIVLGQAVGVVEGTLVGTEQNPDSHVLGFQPRVIVGLDPKTGKELWRHEPGTMVSIQLMQERVSYVLERQAGIWFIEPRTGEVTVQIPFGKSRYYNQFLATDGMIVAVNLPVELVVIRP